MTIKAQTEKLPIWGLLALAMTGFIEILTETMPAGLLPQRRRPRLLVAVIGFLLFNTITALSSSYPLTLAARFLAGVAAGLGWGIIPGYARLMVPEQQKGRGMAIATVGTPLALALGVPAGAFLGKLVNWRTTFLAISGLALVLVVWIGELPLAADIPIASAI